MIDVSVIWGWIAYLISLLGGYLALAQVFRVRNRPAGYVRLSTPPSWEAVVYGKLDNDLTTLFHDRYISLWFRIKAFIGVLGFAGIMLASQPVRWKEASPLEMYHRHYGVHMRFLLRTAVHYWIRPQLPFTCLGYASKAGSSHKQRELGLRPCQVILGLEAWLKHFGPYVGTAVDHELFHCLQHTFNGLFDVEHDADKSTQNTTSFRMWQELGAQFVGSPLALYTLVVVVFWPLLAFGG